MSPYADHDPELSGVGFAVILRRQRLAAGMTQEELASRSGLGVRTVRELERGRGVRPLRGTITLLADARGLTGIERETFIAAAAARRPAARGVAPLPIQPDLLGRDRDVVELTDLLDTADLVSLLGLAGVGKSALALAVAHRYAAAGREAVHIQVSAVAGTDDVLSATASQFGVHRAEELSRRQGLLVVDGVDRSPDAAREAIQWLRTRAQGVKILATSRSAPPRPRRSPSWSVGCAVSRWRSSSPPRAAGSSNCPSCWTATAEEC